MKLIINFANSFLILLFACNSQKESKTQPTFNDAGYQVINKKWLQHSKTIVNPKLKFETKELINDSTVEYNVDIYDTDPSLQLIQTPIKYDTSKIFLIDTTIPRIINHHSFNYVDSDTVHLKFVLHNKRGRAFLKLGMLYKLNNLFYFADTTLSFQKP